MKRQHFLLLAGLLACFVGFSLIAAPGQMLGNITTIPDAEGATTVMRWMGTGLVAIGCINILAKNDPGSPALHAIIVGNITLHVIAEVLDLIDYRSGIVKSSGVVMGTVVHVGLILGFIYYSRGSGHPSGAQAPGGSAGGSPVS